MLLVTLHSVRNFTFCSFAFSQIESEDKDGAIESRDGDDDGRDGGDDEEMHDANDAKEVGEKAAYADDDDKDADDDKSLLTEDDDKALLAEDDDKPRQKNKKRSLSSSRTSTNCCAMDLPLENVGASLSSSIF